MARKNNLETSIGELLKRRSVIENKIGEENFSSMLDILVEEALKKNPDFKIGLTRRGRPGANIHLSDLIKNNDLNGWLKGAGWEYQYSFQEIFSTMCEELGYSTKDDMFKLGIVLSDIGVLKYEKKKDLCVLMNEIADIPISESSIYKRFAKIGMGNDKYDYIESFFPTEERQRMKDEVESYLCMSIEEGVYEDYQHYLIDCAGGEYYDD